MRSALLAFAIAVLILPMTAFEQSAQAQTDLPPNPEIESTIQRQIDAFLADDLGAAFSYASPGIKGMFGTPERFGRMVRQGYPMVWRPGTVRYLDLRRDGDRRIQRVMITDREGALHLLEYQMIPAADGWQINGVTVLRAPTTGA